MESLSQYGITGKYTRSKVEVFSDVFEYYAILFRGSKIQDVIAIYIYYSIFTIFHFIGIFSGINNSLSKLTDFRSTIGSLQSEYG